jgi:hypothetical protein
MMRRMRRMRRMRWARGHPFDILSGASASVLSPVAAEFFPDGAPVWAEDRLERLEKAVRKLRA